jgi:hypothetical protein
MIAGLVALGCL